MTTYLGRSYGQSVTCLECGARVDASHQDAHDNWHAQVLSSAQPPSSG